MKNCSKLVIGAVLLCCSLSARSRAEEGIMLLSWDLVTKNAKEAPTTVTLYAVYQATDTSLTSFSRVAAVSAKQTTTTLLTGNTPVGYCKLKYTIGKKASWAVMAVDSWGNKSPLSNAFALPIDPPKKPFWKQVYTLMVELPVYVKP